MAHPKSVDDTVSTIKTKTREKHEKSTTLGWDVVVNYSVDAINKLLRVTFAEQPQTHIGRQLEFDVADFDFRTNVEANIRYLLRLGEPLIQFRDGGDQGPSCNLTIPIVGGTVTTSEPRSNVIVPPGAYTLVLANFKLATAKGSSDADTKDHTHPFVFGSDTNQGCVVIHLPTSANLRVTISRLNVGIPIVTHKIPDMQQSIEALFVQDNVYQTLRYVIARVKSAAPPVPGVYHLQPKSFRFNAFVPSEDNSQNAGVLSLFIQTRSNNYGTEDELLTAWVNLWRRQLGCFPIPVGKTASIFFSKEMIYESVIQSAITAKGYTVERIDDGYSIKMKIDPRKHIHGDVQNKTEFLVSRHVSGFDKDVPPFQLELTEGGSSGEGVISWEFDFSYSWSSQLMVPELRGGVGPVNRPVAGFFKVTHKIKESRKARKASLNDTHLVLDCSVSSSDWEVTTRSNDLSFWEKIAGATERLPDWAVVKVDLPEFKLTLANVNFFLTTNLLFPADKHVINVDRESGLRIPGDFYLVGDVVDK